MNTIFIFGAILTINFCDSFEPEFQFYNQKDQKGDGLILRSKQRDLSTISPMIVSNWMSSCGKGVWYIYTESNFTGASSYLWNYWKDNLDCSNDTGGPGMKSIRYLGPSHTERPSISLYEFPQFVGGELIVENLALTNFPFVPKALFTTGRSNWTFYSGINFSGNMSCFTSTDENFHRIATLDPTVLVYSVLRGCDNPQIDKFISGKELETLANKAEAAA